MEEYFNQINDSNKVVKKKALESILIIAQDDNEEMVPSEDNLRDIIKCLTDKYERCREISCQIIKILVSKDKETLRQFLPHLFQIFSRRLSAEEEYEPSEEVRIHLMQLLSSCYQTYTTDLAIYTEDTIEIIINMLDDKCPDIKKTAADTLIRIAPSNKKVMMMKGSSLVPPLARNIR